MYAPRLPTLSTSRANGIDVRGWTTRVSGSNEVECPGRSLTVLLRVLVATDKSRGLDDAISPESMNAPLPAGFSAGGGGTAWAVVRTEDTPGVFTGNLDISKIRCLNLTGRFDHGH